MNKGHRLIFLAVTFVAVATWVGYRHYQLRQHGNAKVTISRMSQLMYVIEAAAPVQLDENAAQEAVARYGQEYMLTDGWGHPLIVERGRSGYVIISLGRDGVRGRCCRGSVEREWDADAVLEGRSWRQIWRW